MLSDACKKEILHEVENCLVPAQACLEALQIVVSHYGWVSDERLQELGELLGMTEEELDGIATFYNHIYRRPVGRHVILVCDSVTCWIMGYETIQEYLSKRLGVALGQTTADGRFTLLPIQCLGACDQAPAMMIDDELFTDLDQGKIEILLERYT